jgi:hypothetical protein
LCDREALISSLAIQGDGALAILFDTNTLGVVPSEVGQGSRIALSSGRAINSMAFSWWLFFEARSPSSNEAQAG